MEDYPGQAYFHAANPAIKRAEEARRYNVKDEMCLAQKERKENFAEAREALEHVVKVLNTGTEGAIQLWDILTALRGPDSDDSALKYKTTTNIRGKIGLVNPSYLALSDRIESFPTPGRNFVSAAVTNDEPARLDAEDGVSLHFRQHYNCAVKALQDLGYVSPKEIQFTQFLHTTWDDDGLRSTPGSVLPARLMKNSA